MAGDNGQTRPHGVNLDQKLSLTLTLPRWAWSAIARLLRQSAARTTTYIDEIGADPADVDRIQEAYGIAHMIDHALNHLHESDDDAHCDSGPQQ